MLCAVCGDKATGRNFGAITCESCKSFYRRHVHRPVLFHCPSGGQCQINTNTRRSCPHCRLQKCFDVGMQRPAVGTPVGVVDDDAALTAQISETVTYVTAPFTGQEITKEVASLPAMRVIVCHTETALRRYVKGLKRLLDFASLPHQSQLFALRKNLIEQFQFFSLVNVSDQVEAWLLQGADGKTHENRFDDFVAFGRQFGFDFQSYITQYTKFIKCIRENFPDDWRFVTLVLSILSCFSTQFADPLVDKVSQGALAHLDSLLAKYLRYLQRYLHGKYGGLICSSKLQFCVGVLHQVRPVAQLNTIVLSQLLRGTPDPLTVGTQDEPVSAAASIAPLLAETVFKSLNDSSD